MKVINENEIVIPKELKEEMRILGTVLSPVKEGKGILIMGENMEPDNYKGGLSVIRLYLLNGVNSEYQIEREVAAFAFYTFESAYEFLVKLPEMSALELLITMNNPRFGFVNENSNHILQ